jgi:exodeoxyribonuclease VII small subunit
MEPAAQGAEQEQSFETALTRLTEIVEALEKGDLPLERSLALFEEGVRLSRLGAERLENAELRVEQLLASSQTKPIALDDTKSAKEKHAKEPTR